MWINSRVYLSLFFFASFFIETKEQNKCRLVFIKHAHIFQHHLSVATRSFYAVPLCHGNWNETEFRSSEKQWAKRAIQAFHICQSTMLPFEKYSTTKKKNCFIGKTTKRNNNLKSLMGSNRSGDAHKEAINLFICQKKKHKVHCRKISHRNCLRNK